MGKPEPKPALTDQGSSELEPFGFDRPDEDWLDRVRAAEASPALGSLGAYRLLEEISRGAQGVVYRARQPNTKRDVAVKRMLGGSLATTESRIRFEREVEAACSLNHPNIVTVYGLDVVDQQPLLAMEWIDGEPVSQWAAAGEDGGPRPVRQILEMFLRICNAVQHAHQHGVIHRDLKPNNILVDRDGQPHLLDFGLAKMQSPDDSGQIGMTQTGEFVGTPAYAAPEQARFDHEAIDVRTDLYALGIILYEMTTGAFPYPVERNVKKLIETIETVEPKRPSSVSARIDVELDTILLKALAKDPNQRYQSVDAFAADIRRYLAGEPILAHPPSAIYQLRKFVHRHRLKAALALTVVVGLALATVGATIGMWQANQARAEAEQQKEAALQARAEAERQERVAEAINDFLDQMLASVDPRNEGPDVRVREVLDQAAARVETDLAEHPAVERGVRTTIGNTYRALGLYDEALPHLERALELDIALHGKDHPAAAAGMNELGLLLRDLARYAEEEALHREALAIRLEHFGQSAPAVATSMMNLAFSLYQQGRYDEGRPLFLRAFEIRSAQGQRDEAFAGALDNLAFARYSEGDYAAAEALLREALALMRELLGEEHPGTVGQINNVGGMLMSRGRFAEAEPLFREALDKFQQIHGRQHPSVATAYNNLGETLRRMGRYEEAEAEHRKALAIRREMLGDDHPQTAKSMNNLALTLSQLERYDEALVLHEEALAIRRQRLGDEHPHVSTSLNNMAFVHYKTEHYEQAEPLYREVLAIRKASLGDSHPLTANARMGLARCLNKLDALDEAETLCRAALATQQEQLDAAHPETAHTKMILGRILTSAGRYEAAERWLLESLETLRERSGDSDERTVGVYRDLISLYERWGLSEQAEQYRALLERAAAPTDAGP